MFFFISNATMMSGNIRPVDWCYCQDLLGLMCIANTNEKYVFLFFQHKSFTRADILYWNVMFDNLWIWQASMWNILDVLASLLKEVYGLWKDYGEIFPNGLHLVIWRHRFIKTSCSKHEVLFSRNFQWNAAHHCLSKFFHIGTQNR